MCVWAAHQTPADALHVVALANGRALGSTLHDSSPRVPVLPLLLPVVSAPDDESNMDRLEAKTDTVGWRNTIILINSSSLALSILIQPPVPRLRLSSLSSMMW